MIIIIINTNNGGSKSRIIIYLVFKQMHSFLKPKFWYMQQIFLCSIIFYDCFFKTDHFYSMLIKKNILYFVYNLHMQIQLKTKNNIFMLRFQC